MDVKDEIVVQKVKQSILSVDKDAEIILFGSRARGNAREDSDWDFLFLTSVQVTSALKETVLRKIFDVELDENAAVQILTKSKPDWENRYSGTPLYLNIQDEGIRI